MKRRKEENMKTISGRKVLWKVVVVVAVSILWTWGMVRPDDASAGTDPCKLLTAGEIEAVVGEKVSIPPRGQLADPKSGMPSPCDITIGNGPDHVAVSFAQKTAGSDKDKGDKVMKESLEGARKQGFKVTEEKRGNSSCYTMIPPASHRPTDPRSMGYLTSCSAIGGKGAAFVNVFVHSEGKIVPISKLMPLAEKAASRL